MFGFGRKKKQRYVDDDNNDGGGPRPSRETLGSLNYTVSLKHAVKIGRNWVDARAIKAWLDKGVTRHLHTGVAFTSRDKEKVAIRAGTSSRRSDAYREGLMVYLEWKKEDERGGRRSRLDTDGSRKGRNASTTLTAFQRKCKENGGTHTKTRRCRFDYELTIPESFYRSRNYVNVSTECDQRGKCGPYRITSTWPPSNMRSPY